RIEGGDIAPALVALRDRRTPDSRRWTQEVSRLLRSATFANTERAGGSTDDVGLVVALAFPERIARRVDTSAHGATFLLASGTRAGITGSLAGTEWLAVAD